MRSIVWFKTDLRLHDNETLVRAIEQSREVIPVYCFDESHFKQTEYGFKKTGYFRAKFLLESLHDLDQNLRALGSGLVVLRGKPHQEIAKYAKQQGVQKVFSKKEVAYEEKQEEELLEKQLWEFKCTLETFSTSTLYHAQDLPFSIKDIPDVFTNFRKRVERDGEIRAVFNASTKIQSPKIDSLILPTLKELGFTEQPIDNRAAIQFVGGETSGLQRLNYYLFESKLIHTYKETRNGLVGPDYSSKFSVWLAHGCLSPREIYYEIKRFEELHGANDSTYWLVFELLWRDYFRFMMKKYRQQFFKQSGIKSTEVKHEEHNPQLFDAWMNGTTGNDFVDANMLELKHTGFMSNRGRQIVASYLCYDLKLDWRYGAAYFEQQLIDYDVCSNWGNWAYVAGVGNDPRGNRYFDTNKQALQYDSTKTYRNLWLTKN